MEDPSTTPFFFIAGWLHASHSRSHDYRKLSVSSAVRWHQHKLGQVINIQIIPMVIRVYSIPIDSPYLSCSPTEQSCLNIQCSAVWQRCLGVVLQLLLTCHKRVFTLGTLQRILACMIFSNIDLCISVIMPVIPGGLVRLETPDWGSAVSRSIYFQLCPFT